MEFPDGKVSAYTANIIAEHMVMQCDPAGNQLLLMDEIIDHKKDGSALQPVDKWVYRHGKRHLRKSTKGWALCVRWKDGSTTWQALSSLKESHPIQVAEYAVASGIDTEPAYEGWVPYVLKKRN